MRAAKKQPAAARERVFEDIVRILQKYPDGAMKAIADKAGVHKMTLYWWKTGVTRAPRLSTFIPVAEAMGYDVTLQKRKGPALVRVK